jgi:cytohesin
MSLLEELAARVNEPTKDNSTLLHKACEEGNAQLALGADVNADDHRQYSPLHVAAERGHLAIVKMLIRKGADLNAQTGDWSLTAYTLAKESGHPQVARALYRAEHPSSSSTRSRRSTTAPAAGGRRTLRKLTYR